MRPPDGERPGNAAESQTESALPCSVILSPSADGRRIPALNEGLSPPRAKEMPRPFVALRRSLRAVSESPTALRVTNGGGCHSERSPAPRGEGRSEESAFSGCQPELMRRICISLPCPRNCRPFVEFTLSGANGLRVTNGGAQTSSPAPAPSYPLVAYHSRSKSGRYSVATRAHSILSNSMTSATYRSSLLYFAIVR